ncbi:unnamed protein product [Cladocopium goreaui]|uniref:Cysteine desulfurase, mitochondrial n=1 Tax=Cladocopium goreaui TaxID=2562237 RepID=A0A9P1CY08_9DINO|nr:unnamed protein product [Cladocopium goreaui]
MELTSVADPVAAKSEINIINCDDAKKEEKDAAPQEEKEPGTIILFWLCCVSALEGMDTQLVPACQFALQRDLGLQLGHFAVLTTVQMVLTNLAAPFWGILADRGTLRKKTILMLGAIGEGVAITIFAFVPNFWVMMLLRGMSGFFLASLRPVCNGLIADLTSDNKRGKIFGRVQSALLVGMFCSLLIAGNVANTYAGDIPGWRFLFAGGGAVAFIVALGLGGFLAEPHHQLDESAKVKGCAAVRTELCTVLSFLRIPTFCVMIMQGVFGTIPWSVMGNNLLFFKFCGLADWQASILAAEGTVAGVFGNSIGGMIADALARRFGYHGRPLSAQITVAIGIPMVFLQFYGIPPGEGTFGVYFALIAAFGLLGSWAQSGTNFPILSDIVPASDRSKVMAWECAMENSLANAIGPSMVSTLAFAFGYKFGAEEMSGQSLSSARALGQAMAATICIPWVITLAAYTLLHWSYPRDMRRLRAKQAAAEAAKEEQAV